MEEAIGLAGLGNGYFSCDHGNITNRLAKMYMELVKKYSTKPNWRGYSFIDEMRSSAIEQLIVAGLKFDESKSSNPFAFYTQLVKNQFRSQLIIEKKNRTIRDELLLAAGSNPSDTMMIEHELNNKTN